MACRSQLRNMVFLFARRTPGRIYFTLVYQSFYVRTPIEISYILQNIIVTCSIFIPYGLLSLAQKHWLIAINITCLLSQLFPKQKLLIGTQVQIVLSTIFCHFDAYILDVGMVLLRSSLYSTAALSLSDALKKHESKCNQLTLHYNSQHG